MEGDLGGVIVAPSSSSGSHARRFANIASSCGSLPSRLGTGGGGPLRDTLGFLSGSAGLAFSMALGTGLIWPLISRTMGTSETGIAPPRRTMGAGVVGAMGFAGVMGVSGMSWDSWTGTARLPRRKRPIFWSPTAGSE